MAVAQIDINAGAGNDVRDNSPARGDSGASAGVLSLTTDPPNRYPGMIWYRSDLSQISVETGGGVVKRVTVA